MTQFVAKLHALENVHVSFPKWGGGVKIFGGENPPWIFHTCHFTYTCLGPTHLSLKSEKNNTIFYSVILTRKLFSCEGKKLIDSTMYLGFFKKNYFIYQNDKMKSCIRMILQNIKKVSR